VYAFLSCVPLTNRTTTSHRESERSTRQDDVHSCGWLTIKLLSTTVDAQHWQHLDRRFKCHYSSSADKVFSVPDVQFWLVVHWSSSSSFPSAVQRLSLFRTSPQAVRRSLIRCPEWTLLQVRSDVSSLSIAGL